MLERGRRGAARPARGLKSHRLEVRLSLQAWIQEKVKERRDHWMSNYAGITCMQSRGFAPSPPNPQ